MTLRNCMSNKSSSFYVTTHKWTRLLTQQYFLSLYTSIAEHLSHNITGIFVLMKQCYYSKNTGTYYIFFWRCIALFARPKYDCFQNQLLTDKGTDKVDHANSCAVKKSLVKFDRKVFYCPESEKTILVPQDFRIYPEHLLLSPVEPHF